MNLTPAQLAQRALAQYADLVREYVDDLEENPANHELADVAKSFKEITDNHKELDALVKKVYHAKEALNKHFIPKMLEDAGMDLIRVPEIGYSFSIRNNLSASMIDKDKGLDWLKSHGHAELVQETVNAGTLASFAKALMLEEGIDLPSDIFKLTPYKSTGMNKYTPK